MASCELNYNASLYFLLSSSGSSDLEVGESCLKMACFTWATLWTGVLTGGEKSCLFSWPILGKTKFCSGGVFGSAFSKLMFYFLFTWETPISKTILWELVRWVLFLLICNSFSSTLNLGLISCSWWGFLSNVFMREVFGRYDCVRVVIASVFISNL